MISEEAVKIRGELQKTILDKYGAFFNSISKISAQKITDDVLSPKKIDEQVSIIERISGEKIAGKKILEIGSGFGIFTIVTNKTYGADSYGVEPGSEGFGGSYELSQTILKDSGVDPKRVKMGVGESLPFPDNSFDIVYSTNVLEHVTDPAKVISEAIRVTKSGGFIQIVFPSYGSFYDGHYACMYLPYQPKWLWKLWLKYVLRRDTAFVDTLRTELNYFSIRKILMPFINAKKIEVVSTGEEIFRERMTTIAFTPYAGLTKIKRLVEIMHKFRIVQVAIWTILLIKAHSPLIISIRKSPF